MSCVDAIQARDGYSLSDGIHSGYNPNRYGDGIRRISPSGYNTAT
jgi:hypothetical protein